MKPYKKFRNPEGVFAHKEWQNNFLKFFTSLTHGAAVWPSLPAMSETCEKIPVG